MSDISQGPGFEMPSYDELMNQYGGSGSQDKLEKVSQILATAQMTHAVLSNFEPYKAVVEKVSNTVFDPIKNELVSVAGKAQNVMGKIPGASGNISAEDALSLIKNPGKAKVFLKGKLAEGEQFVKGKLSEVKSAGSKALKSIESGEVPEVDFMNKDKLLSAAADFAKKSDISDRIVSNFNDVVNQRYEAIPDDIKQNLLDMGIGENDLRQVVSGSAPRDLMEIAKQRLGPGSKYSDPFTPDELDIPEEYLNKLYKARKFLDKLKMPVEEGGSSMGDSTLARLGKTAKSTYNDVKSSTQSIVDEFEQAPLKVGKRLKVKLDAQARKRTADLQEQMNAEPEFPEVRPTAAKPLVNEFEEVPEINLSNNMSRATTQQMATEGEDIATTDESVSGVAGSIQKAKNVLTKATEDTADLDEFGIGDLINAGLGIATVATMIAGLFDTPVKPETVAQGEQLGV